MAKKKWVKCGTCVGPFDKPGKIGIRHPSGDPKKTRYIKCFICRGKGKVPVDPR